MRVLRVVIDNHRFREYEVESVSVRAVPAMIEVTNSYLLFMRRYLSEVHHTNESRRGANPEIE